MGPTNRIALRRLPSRWLVCIVILANAGGSMLLPGLLWSRLKLSDLDNQLGIWDADQFWLAIVRENKQLCYYQHRYQAGNVALCQMRLGLDPDCLPHRGPGVIAFANREDLDRYLIALPQGQQAQVFVLIATDIDLRLRPVAGGHPGQVYAPRLAECGNYWFFTQVGSAKGKLVWESLIGGFWLRRDAGAWRVLHLDSLPQVVASTKGHDYTGDLGRPTIIWFAYPRARIAQIEQHPSLPASSRQRHVADAIEFNELRSTNSVSLLRGRVLSVSNSPLVLSYLSFIALFSKEPEFVTPRYADLSENLATMKAEVYPHDEILGSDKGIPEFEIPKRWWGEFYLYLSQLGPEHIEPTIRPKPKERLGKVYLEMKDGRKYLIYFYSWGHNPALLEVNDKHWVWANYNWFHRARDGAYDMAKLIEYIYTQVRGKEK